MAAIDASKLALILQYFDTSYIRTPPGKLKILQLVNALIGFICSEMADKYRGTANWFSFVAMTGFWVTLILLVFYMLHLLEKLLFVPWVQAELCYTALWSCLYFIAATLAAFKAADEDALAAAAAFGFVGMLLYGFDAAYKYRGWKSGAAVAGSVAPGAAVDAGGVDGALPAEAGVSLGSPTANYPAY